MPVHPELLDVLTVEPTATAAIRITFSDRTQGELDAAWLADKSGSLLQPLHAPGYFTRAFVDGGGLCWPNGLELSAHTLQSWLRERGALQSVHRAA